MKTINPLGIHAAVFVGDLKPESCEIAARRAAGCGFDVLELPVFETEAVNADELRLILQDHGLVGVCSLGLDFDADISSTDSAIVSRGEARLRSAIEVAAGLGGSFLGGVIYSALGKYDRPPEAAGRDAMVSCLRRLAMQAADRGVVLGLEAVNRYESNIINTCRQAVEVIEEVGLQNIVVHLDSYHANLEEISFAQAVSDCGKHLGYVHIGESHRGYLGTGSVDLDGLFTALHGANYEGKITFESFSRAVLSPDLSNRLAIWRNLWTDGDDLARKAHAYMSERLSAGQH